MAGDLTSLEALKRYLGREEGVEEPGETSDDLLKELITAASGLVTRFARREFAGTEAEEERAFAHDGGLFLDLDPFEVREVASVKIIRGGSETTLETAAYGLRPLPSIEGVYQWMMLASDPGVCEVEVKGKWGFEKVPGDVATWTHLTIAEWLRGGVYAYTQEIEAAALYSSRSLPRMAETGLEDTYRRPVIA
jgi:hypothetical protein